MPDPDVFLPFDIDRLDLAIGEESERRFDGRCKAGVPGRKQRRPACRAAAISGVNPPTVAPGGFSSNTCLPASTRWQRARDATAAACRSQPHRSPVLAREHFVQRPEMDNAADRGIGIGDRDKLGALGGRQCGDMLVPGDLAGTDDSDTNGHGSMFPPSRMANRTICPIAAPARAERFADLNQSIEPPDAMAEIGQSSPSNNTRQHHGKITLWEWPRPGEITPSRGPAGFLPRTGGGWFGKPREKGLAEN